MQQHEHGFIKKLGFLPVPDYLFEDKELATEGKLAWSLILLRLQNGYTGDSDKWLAEELGITIEDVKKARVWMCS